MASTGAAGADPCAGNPRCYAAGPFVAEVVQLMSARKERNNHLVRVSVRFRNVGHQPLILAYRQRSGRMLDDYGQQYTIDWRYDEDVAGMGQTTRSKADPRFVLRPGEASTATFTFRRYVGKSAIGTVFSPDFVIEQLEILPSQQIRSVREYSVSFTSLSAAGPAPASVRSRRD